MNYDPYIRTPHYYETDQMGVVHHSNFVRWLEETRVNFMAKNGVSYAELEQNGIVSPILSVACEFKAMVRYGAIVRIDLRVTHYTGVRLSVEYTLCDNVTGELYCTAQSAHCFLNKAGRIVSLKKAYPPLDEVFREAAEE